ncbi:hypothetical protein [Roseicella sp. DB1501]|uniref:hypothetical protein n=1 Tax=Roseicella sp. DB1501 TaxID=2730925 RepID=UPI00149261DD|nr:hypothetical protein [Roseicella sp. DB1501]NOG69730.1 hypothetical protein [Roseicella sp. DB1501]
MTQAMATLHVGDAVVPLGLLWSRAVLARYLDARERGLSHRQALGEAGGLLAVFVPSLSPREAEAHAERLVCHSGQLRLRPLAAAS